jgi:hypothetical protein
VAAAREAALGPDDGVSSGTHPLFALVGDATGLGAAGTRCVLAFLVLAEQKPSQGNKSARRRRKHKGKKKTK